MAIDVRTPVKMLGIAERQTIEIVRALSLDARVLIMDEPTSAISSSEVDRLFEIVLRLKQQGVAILFISHFIDEILRMGDEVTILRSGPPGHHLPGRGADARSRRSGTWSAPTSPPSSPRRRR